MMLSTTGTRSNDVSTVLAIVSAVQTANITPHPQAERYLLKLTFAFHHISYFRYNSFEHVFLKNLSKDNSETFDYRLRNGFGATSSIETFSTIHGYIDIKEHCHKKSKGTVGPYRPEYISHHNRLTKR